MLVTENGTLVPTFEMEPNLNPVIATGICNLKLGTKDEDQAPGKNPVVQAMQEAFVKMKPEKTDTAMAIAGDPCPPDQTVDEIYPLLGMDEAEETIAWYKECFGCL